MNGNSHRLFVLLASLLLLSCAPGIRAEDLPELARIKAAAEAGDAVAQFKLAESFSMHADPEQAALWYRKACEQDYVPAQARFGSLLLGRYRILSGLMKPEEKAAVREEILKWLTLAANLGDSQAQGDLARVYFEGKLVNQDLIAAYKWGSLAAAHVGLLNMGAITGKSTCDSAILKMTQAQIAEGERQLAAFRPQKVAAPKAPARPLPPGLKLNGISGSPSRRFALINGKTLAVGESATIKLSGTAVAVRCVEIRTASVLISVEGTEGTQELGFK